MTIPARVTEMGVQPPSPPGGGSGWTQPNRAWSARSRAAAGLATMLGIWAFYWWPVLSGKHVLFARDLPLYWYSAKHYWLERISAGELPLWFPQVGLGMPFAADLANQTFYPPNLVFLLTPDPIVGIGWFGALHVLGGMIAVFALARRLRLGVWIATWGGVVYGLSGVVLSGTSNLTYLPITLWGPLAIWVLLGAAPGWIRALRAGVCIAMVALAGDVLDAAVLSGIGVLMLGSRAVRREETPKGAALGVGLLIATALSASAVQLVPTLDVFYASVRGSGLSAGEIGRWSFPPIRAVEFLHPNFFGSRFPVDEYFGAGLYPHNGYGWYESIYLGVVPIALAVFGLVKTGTKHLGFLSLVVVFGILSVGGHLPGFADWIVHLPFFNTQRYPEKLLVWGNFGVVMLSLIGAHLCLRDALQHRWSLSWVSRLALAALVAIVVLIASLHWPLRYTLGDISSGISAWWSIAWGRPIGFGQGLMLHAALMLLPVLALILWRRFRAAMLGIALIAVVVDLLWMHAYLARHAERDWLGFDDPPKALSAIWDHRERGESVRVLVAGRRLYPPPSGDYPTLIWKNKFLFDRLFYNGATRFNVTYMNADFSPLAPQVRVSQVGKTIDSYAIDTLRASGIDFVVTGLGAPEERQWVQAGARWVWEDPTLDVRVFEIRQPQPLVSLSGTEPGSIRYVRHSPEQWSIDIPAGESTNRSSRDKPRHLVVRETYDPNWQATSTVGPVGITSTPDGFIAMAVLPEATTIDLRYSLPSVGWGAWLSLGWLGGWILVETLTRRKPRRGPARIG
ncbi:MAG: hypothetical protein AAF493_08430 [Pseudomonadota bacterium]